MGDQNELHIQFPTEGEEQISNPLLIDFVHEPERFIQNKKAALARLYVDESGESQSEGGDIDNAATGLIRRIIKKNSLAEESKSRIRFSAFALKDDPEGIWVIEDGFKAFRYDARYPGVSLFLDVFGNTLDNALCFLNVPNVPDRTFNTFPLIADLNPQMVPSGEDAVQPSPDVADIHVPTSTPGYNNDPLPHSDTPSLVLFGEAYCIEDKFLPPDMPP